MKFDLSDFTVSSAEVDKLVGKAALAEAQKLTLDLHRGLVEATPVDTGAARAGWTVEVPSLPFQQGVIENQVPYIGVLNDGHSKQAPSNFVENTIDAVVKIGG